MATTVPHNGISSNFAKGSRSQQNLNSAYPDSPLYDGSYLPEIVEKMSEAVLNGEGDGPDVQGGIVNDGGHFFGTVDLNYSDAPVLADVETGGGGLPSTPYTPNLVSPGPGSVSAGDQDAYDGTVKATGQWGSGLPGTTSPSSTSTEISKQTIGDLISGKSYLGSDGTT